MENDRAIPPGYMTIGQVAKRMGVTVRTLQYYDKEGLLIPSAESEGGRRLYTDRDVIRLHQILSLKHLCFSLDYIKNHLLSLDTPEDVAQALSEQAASIREKINSLSEALKDLELLQEEVLKMQSVDFKKYADIVVNLQMDNKYYWMVKQLDEKFLGHARAHYDQESAREFIERFQDVCDQIRYLQEHAVPPESPAGQKCAGEFWELVMEFTGGDVKLLPDLIKIGTSGEWSQKQEQLNQFIEPALDTYFTSLGYDPMEGKQQ